MSSVHPPLVRTRLSAMMFLEFFIWGGWFAAIPGYAGKILHFSGPQIGSLMSTTAIGAILAPLFVGYVADRLFATEKILSLLHFLGGVCLILVARQSSYWPMLALLMLNGLVFMPTMALANSLAFRHIPDAAKFPRIAVLGTIGWIVANLIVQVLLGGVDQPRFFYLSGGASIVMSLYCLTLPHTPPKGGAAGDVFGLDALKLLRDPTFLVFTLCAFLVAIPIWSFFVATVPMLQERGYPAPLALMTLNQFSEIVFMFSMPLFVAWLGLKRVLVIGMLAWAVRYACFAVGGFPVVVAGLLVHGLCYSFVFVGAYMYVDRRAPADIKASAQSLVSFLLLGVANYLGCNGAGLLMEQYPAPVAATMTAFELPAAGATPVENAKAPLPGWNDPAAATSVWRYLDLSGTINSLRNGKQEQPAAEPDLGSLVDANHDGVITRAELDKIPAAGLRMGNLLYPRDKLIAVFEKVAALNKAGGAEWRVTREEWLAAQAHQWQHFWPWPAGAALLIGLLFAAAFRDAEKQLDA